MKLLLDEELTKSGKL